MTKHLLLLKKIAVLLIMLVGLLLAGNVEGATITITSDINWSAITGGSGTGGLPNASDDINVRNGATLTVNVNNAVCASIQLGVSKNGTGTLLFSSSNSQLTVIGNFTIGDNSNGANAKTGSLDMTIGGSLKVGGSLTTPNLGTWAPGNGTIEYTGSVAQTIYSNAYNNLTLSGSGTKTLQAGITKIDGNFTLSGSVSTSAVVGLTIGGDVTIGSGTTFNGGSFTHTISGNWTNNGGTYTPGTGTIVMNGVSKVIGGSASTTFNNLTLSGSASVTAAIGTIIGGDLTIGSGTTFNGGSYTHTISGNWTNNGGTYTPGTGTIVMNGVSKTIGGSSSTSFNNLNISGGTTTTGANLTIGGNLNISDGSTFTLAGANSLTVAGTTIIGGGTSGTLNISGWNTTETFTGLVTINSGGTWNNSANLPVNFRGGITNNGAFLPGTGTQTFDSKAQTLNGNINMTGAPVTVTGITVTNNGTLTLTANFGGTGTILNPPGGTVNLSSYTTIASITNQGTLNLSGSNYINPTTLTNQGTLNLTSTQGIGTATANFNNTGTVNLNGTNYIAGITNNAGGTVNFINAAQTIGTFNNATATSLLNISALITSKTAITNLTATVTGNTVNYNGSGDQTVKNTTYSNLILSGSGIKTAGEVITVNTTTAINGVTFNSGGFNSSLGILTMGSNSTIALGSGVHTLNFSNSSAASWSGTLTVTGWIGSYNGTSGTAGKLFFGNSSSGLTSGQLAQIQFFDGTSNFPVTILNTGEVVPLGSANSIATGSISGSPFCAGAAISVPFSKTGNFNLNNVFTAQLSNSVGSFTSPVSIGTLTQTTSGTISGIIPIGTSAGTGYRIRVVSSNPVVTGSDNGSNLTVSIPIATITSPTSSNITTSSADLGGNITSIGCSNVTEQGIFWSTTNGFADGAGTKVSTTGTYGTGTFSVPVTGLTPSTTYYFKAFATNSGGTTYSAQGSFTTASVLATSFWYKADIGTSSTSNGVGVNSWDDQSGLSNNASAQNAAPVYQTLGWNFNPNISFSAGYYLTSGNSIADDMTFFAVYSSTQNAGSVNFWETPAIIGGETSNVQNDYTLSTNSGKLYFKGTSGDGFGAQTTGTYYDGLVKIVSVTRQKSSTGNIYLYVNGAQSANAASDNNSLSAPTKLGIGNHFSYVASAQFVGYIGEVFGTNSVYSQASRQNFESYLALKYGVTLAHDYTNGTGTTVYPISTYGNDIAGLGNDATYRLDQKISSSINIPSGSSRVIMATTSDFSSSNLNGARTSLSSGQYLIWGHNGGTTSSWTASGDYSIVNRAWKVQNTNSVGSVNFQIDLTGYPAATGNYTLLVDNDGDFSNGGTSEYALANSSGNLYSASNVPFPSGTSYFTISGCKKPSTLGAISGSTIPCQGSSQTYSVTNVPGVTYTWTFPSGWIQTSGGTTNLVTVTVGLGSGDIKVTPSNGCGYGNASSLAVAVREPIGITSATAAASPICLNSTTILTANGVVGTNAVVTWWTGAGGTGTNLGTGSTLTAGPGTYYARVTGDCGSAVEASVTVAIKTNVGITSATAAASPICSNATTTLTANGVIGTNAVVTWWTGTGGTGTNLGTGSTLTAGPGTYYARVTGDCGSVVEASVTVASKTNVGITSATAAASPICLNSTTILTANGVVGTNAVVTWWTGAGGTGTNLGTGSTLTAGPGTYYARVTGDCGSAVEASVTIASIPNAVVSSVSGSSPLCIGSTSIYSANGVVLGGGTGAWSSDNTSVATVDATGNVTGVSAGTCNITYTITGGCGGAVSSSKQVTIQRINAIVSDADAASADCPGFLGPWDANTNSYNPGVSQVVFRITRESSTTNWGFSYAITGATVHSSSANSQTGSKSNLSDNSVDLFFYITNIPGTQQNVKITITGASDGNCSESNTSDNTVTHIIKAMPAIGSFN